MPRRGERLKGEVAMIKTWRNPPHKSLQKSIEGEKKSDARSLPPGMVYKPHDLPQGQAAARRRRQALRRFEKANPLVLEFNEFKRANADLISRSITDAVNAMEPELDSIEDAMTNEFPESDLLLCAGGCTTPLDPSESKMKSEGWLQTRKGAWVCPKCVNPVSQ